MKIADLAQKLGIPPTELREKIKKLGFDIGKKAKTVRDSVAKEICEKLSQEIEVLKVTDKKTSKELPEQKSIKEEKIAKEEVIEMPEIISVKNFAALTKLPVTTVITELMKNGIFATINENIDFETAAIIADDFGKKVKKAKVLTQEKEKIGEEKKLKPRPPVVLIMGHVDHGKTTLLDYIRKTSVVTQETGGITQHIGAYQTEVKIPKKEGKGVEKRTITFLDTPGHEAFTAMREHGAKITDLAILVVAAEEGVKPQTIEAINHAKGAGVPIIVAINKIDKPQADINKTKRELAEAGLPTEDWGGTTVAIPISAKTGQGVNELLEMVILLADLQELKAVSEGPATGVVIESHIDSGLGPVATILVQKGILKIGDPVVIGKVWGKIRAMKNFAGHKIKKAYPSDPVQIFGLSGVPNFGRVLEVCESEKIAREMVKKNLLAPVVRSIVKPHLATQRSEGKFGKELHIVLKADAAGSLEAIRSSLEGLSSGQAFVKIIHQGVGAVSESDVQTAAAAKGMVVAFRVGVFPTAGKLATSEKINITRYEIIYELIEDIQKILEGLLEPEIIETEVGRAKILKVFTHGKKSQILGAKVTRGKLENDLEIRALRDKAEIGLGKITSLQQNKKSVTEVLEGFECGLGIEGDFSSQIIEGDTLIAFRKEEKLPKLASKNSKDNIKIAETSA